MVSNKKELCKNAWTVQSRFCRKKVLSRRRRLRYSLALDLNRIINIRTVNWLQYQYYKGQLVLLIDFPVPTLRHVVFHSLEISYKFRTPLPNQNSKLLFSKVLKMSFSRLVSNVSHFHTEEQQKLGHNIMGIQYCISFIHQIFVKF